MVDFVYCVFEPVWGTGFSRLRAPGEVYSRSLQVFPRIVSKANPAKIRSDLMRGSGSHRQPKRSRDSMKSGNITVWGTGRMTGCLRAWINQPDREVGPLIANRLANALSVLQDWPLEGVQTAGTLPGSACMRPSKPGTCDGLLPSRPYLIIAQMCRDTACRPAFLRRGPTVRFQRP